MLIRCSNFKLGGLNEEGEAKIVEIDESLFLEENILLGNVDLQGGSLE
jgi:hypothetical protein